MRKGLLAEWRRGIVARGLAAAALLAVPVAVAATIGFGTSLGGLSEGLGSLASGPDEAALTATESDGIDTTIAEIATGTGGGVAPARRRGGPNQGGGSDESAPTQTTPGGATPTQPIGGGGDEAPLPDLGDPVGGAGGGTGAGNAVNEILDNVTNTVNGLLGGGQ